jgi:tetratricopeptide (TPR) repeat protein
LRLDNPVDAPMNRRERRAAGLGSQTKLTRAGTSTPAALHQAGLDHRQAGRNLDAQICCQQALAIDPDHADTLHLMGLLSLDAKQYDHALEWITRAVGQNAKPEYLSSLGTTLQQQGRLEEALNAFDKTAQLAPDDAESWKNRGNVLIDLKRPADAVVSFEQTLKLNPRHWDAAYRCGFLLNELGRHAEAIVYFDLVDRLQPNRAVILEMRAAVLHRLKRFDEALADNQRAYALNPRNATTCNNIGAALQVLGRDNEALPWFERAATLRPDYIEALTNKAASLQQLHRFEEAAATYRHIKTIDPGDAETDWNLSLLQLLTGNFRDGWAGREARWKASRAETSLTFPGPKWRGEENIAGKTILIYMDEGLGDAIQFARYVPEVAARGAHVILLVLPAVYPLLSKLPGVAQCIPFSAAGPQPAFDMHCPMSSLPLVFGTRLDTIPSPVSYLPPPPEAGVQAWQDRLGPHDKLRVGLAWAGNPDHKNDHNRSTSLRVLSRILDIDATFVSLQKDPGPEDQATLREHPGIIDLTAVLIDFSETAALISCLDLVITVDTSVAHLAAALGRPTWILLPYTPDYRWLLDRDDSPWYPTARLFRQDATRDYGEVLDRVRDALLTLTSERQTTGRASSTPTVLQGAGLDWDTASKRGIALHKMGRFQEAHAYFDLCNELQPDHATTLYMRGRSLLDLGRLEEALTDNQRAHELDPTRAEICNSIGAILRSLGREEQALPWFDRALRLQPNSVEALGNRALCLGQMQRFDEAFAAYARVKALGPGNAEIDWNLSLLRMLTGNFELGWAGREARWKRATPPLYPAFSQPKWLGQEPVDGKTVVICADEGLGDTIHFARYVPMVAARGARVLLIVDPPAVSLLSGLPGIFKCFSKAGAALPAFDMHIPICSLPLAFGTRLDTIPAETAYLPPPAAARVHAWEQRLRGHEKSRDKLRIGLVWSGNPAHKNDHNRSMPLRALSRLLDADATFVSLQKEPRPDDKAMLLERPDIIDLTADFHDFSETAALINCLDLVISVDTSVAHLAAALGCPTWILLPYTPDYRWLLGRDDSPWYPTARLFRQSARRDYGEVLDRVRDALLTLIAERQAAGQASPTTPAALYEAGLGHRRAGRHRDARLCCEQALAADHGHADALHLMGLLSFDAGQHGQALEWIAGAIRQDPKPEYLSSLGITLQAQGRHEEALNVFDKAVQLRPDDAGLWKHLGGALMELQRPVDALLSLQHASKLDPRDCDAAYKYLFLLHTLGRFEQALAQFDRCNELQPDHVPALQLRALSLRGLGRFQEALAVNQRAIALAPDNADTCNNLGDALQSLGRQQEALQWFDRAIVLRPELVQALKNKAFVLTQLHRFDEAVAVYQRILALDPANAAAECDLAQLHLLTGNFEAGWIGREAREKLPSSTYPKFSQPMWLRDEAVESKTILVYADEGMGDSIQLARYVPMLAARGAKVILAVEAPAVPLLSQVSGVSQCIAKPIAVLPDFDLHCPMCSLPLAFATRLDSIPSGVSYLPRPQAARVQAWEDRLGPHDRLRVGLCWSGNPNHGNDRNRSLPLRLLTHLLDADATFVSLQRDPRPEDQAVLHERTDIVDLTADLTDFSETAALACCLDLVITVDTSVAHLSAALGRPTWILLPYVPDYRWLLDRDDSPWYPTVRLFRQDETRDYENVLVRMRGELEALISAGQFCQGMR